MPRDSDQQSSLWLATSLSTSKRARGAEFLRQQKVRLGRDKTSA
jgi:hypothetical protein